MPYNCEQPVYFAFEFIFLVVGRDFIHQWGVQLFVMAPHLSIGSDCAKRLGYPGTIVSTMLEESKSIVLDSPIPFRAINRPCSQEEGLGSAPKAVRP